MGSVWQLLSDAHGEREAARVLARLLGAACERGEEQVARALETALRERRRALLDLVSEEAASPRSIAVPPALADYVVESGRATDCDHLLLADGGLP